MRGLFLEVYMGAYHWSTHQWNWWPLYPGTEHTRFFRIKGRLM